MHYNKQVGNLGEDLAKKYLVSRGYEILDCNLKASYKELDIIANQNGKIIFVEVKTRASNVFGSAEDMMSARKLNYMKYAAARYLSMKKINNNNIRFDFIAVNINSYKRIANIKHFKDII